MHDEADSDRATLLETSLIATPTIRSDPPGGLARMAKEMIQISVRQQSDVSAAMAARLDQAESDRLWMEQSQWRTAHPQTWWQGFPMRGE